MSVWHLSYPLLPHDAMHKLGLCHHAVSVCLFVTFVHCVKTNKDIFKFFSPSRSHSVLVFPHRTGWLYSDGNPPNGGVECRWGRVKSWNQWLSGLANCCTVFCTLRPPFCLRWVLDDQVRSTCCCVPCEIDQARSRAIHSHGGTWIMCMTARLDVTPKTTEQNRIIRTDKSEAEVTSNKKLRLRYCTIEANYWQTRSIVRPLCDSRATCKNFPKTYLCHTFVSRLYVSCLVPVPAHWLLSFWIL